MSLDSVIETLGSLPNTGRLPALFLGHGTPFSAIRPNEYTESWARIGEALPKARAILMVSAHWLTRGGVLVTASEKPQMNYDMYGFPEEIYRIQYPAPGNPDLADEVADAIRSRTPVLPDNEWGFDHGTWLPMMYMFPDADIPLIQISMDYSQPPAFHYELAARLTALRSRGVLLLGSGNMTHNLGQRRPATAGPFDWAQDFDTRITQFIRDGDYRSVVNFLNLGTVATTAHPSYDHFLPLLYILGAQAEGETVMTFNESFQEPSVSMKSFLVT